MSKAKNIFKEMFIYKNIKILFDEMPTMRYTIYSEGWETGRPSMLKYTPRTLHLRQTSSCCYTVLVIFMRKNTLSTL